MGIIAEDAIIPGTNITVQRCIEIDSERSPIEVPTKLMEKCIFTTPEGFTIVTEPTSDSKCFGITPESTHLAPV